jgi:hypothetical protein
MKRINLVAVAVIAAATVAVPAWGLPAALPDHGTSANPNAQSHTAPTTTTTTAPTTPTPPSNAKAFGVACRAEEKTHAAHEKGTPFSKCVTAMAKLASGETTSAAKACASEKKKHVSGKKGTPFSRCLSAAAKLHAGAHK